MGIMGIPGSESVNLPNFSDFFSNLGKWAVIIILFGIAIYVLYILFGKKSSTSLKANILCVWYEEINGHMVYVGEDKAVTLIIPRTNIPVLYIKSKNMYLPRPTIKMGRNIYWFAIKNNKEIVNFRMSNLNKLMSEAGLDFDHTDMRYASENLKELINTNYKDKSIPWYIQYKDIISVVILLFVFFVGMYFLLSKIAELVNLSNNVVSTATAYAEKVMSNPGSGVIMK